MLAELSEAQTSERGHASLIYPSINADDSWPPTLGMISKMTPTCNNSEQWIFWAPASSVDIHDALSLGEVRPGERFVDLGCGDGRVLAAATQRGAAVIGYELDEQLAEHAVERLKGMTSSVKIEKIDFFAAPLEANVIFAYLAPSVLQQLATRKLQWMPPSTRIVTLWFSIPNWPVLARRGNCFLHSPGHSIVEQVVSDSLGWETRALLCAVPADREMLSSVYLRHRGGPIQVTASESILYGARLSQGAYQMDGPGRVAIDLIWKKAPEGTLIEGSMHSPGHGSCQIYMYAHKNLWGNFPLSHEEQDRLKWRAARIRSRGRNFQRETPKDHGDK
jgi:SAM-dependent methyltransferase